MTDIKSRNNICSQGIIQNEQPFMIVGVVREGMSQQFYQQTGILNADDKCFILCSCQTLENNNETILYFSNDPNDFIFNYTGTVNNNGILPVRKIDDNFLIDIDRQQNSRTIGFPNKAKFNMANYNSNSYNDLEFFTGDSNYREQSYKEVNFGIPYKMTFANRKRINFYVRKNVTVANNGRYGPSTVHFNESSTIFQELRSHSFAKYGTSFSFDTDKFNQFGMSLLTNDTPTELYTALPKQNNTGIIELRQGTSTWYNIFSNPMGTSTVYFDLASGSDFLNIGICTPIVGTGISVQINLRNKSSNFVSIQGIALTNEEVFDYYYVNLTGFTVGGLANDSSQYFDNSTSDITKGGLHYYPSPKYTYHNFFHKENTKGLIANLNCLNNTTIARTLTDTTILKPIHTTEDSTTYATYYDSLYGINLNAQNDYTGGDNCGKLRTVEGKSENMCTLFGDSDSAAASGKPVFTDKPEDQAQNFYIEIGIMSAILIIYIVMAVLYYKMEV